MRILVVDIWNERGTEVRNLVLVLAPVGLDANLQCLFPFSTFLPLDLAYYFSCNYP